MSLKLISINIEGDNHYDTVFPFLQKENPDVICVQEIFAADLPMFEKQLRAKGIFVPMLTIHGSNPYRISPKGNSGIAIFSRLPYSVVSSATYVGDPNKIPDVAEIQPFETNRCIVALDVTKETLVFRIVTTHLTWTPHGSVTPLQLHDVDALFSLLKPLGDLILCGDFNAPRGKETFTKLANAYKDNIPENITTTMDNALHRNHDLQPFVVDGLFTSRSYIVSDVQVITGVSDHAAVVGRIDKMEVLRRQKKPTY